MNEQRNREIQRNTERSMHYSWLICMACAMLLFCVSGLTGAGFSTYLPFFISEKGLSNLQVSTFSLYRSIFSFISMLSVGWFIRHFEIRKITAAGMLFCAFGFLLYGLGTGYPMYCAAAVCEGIALGIGGNIPTTILITRWFYQHKGLALGICMASTGMATFVASPVITFMVSAFSLRISFLVEAVLVFCLGLLGFVLIRNNPAEKGILPLGRDDMLTVKDNKKSERFLHRDPDRLLYLLLVATICIIGMVANNMHAFFSVLYQSVGMDSTKIAFLISLFGFSLMVGKCMCGFIIDHIGIFRSTCLLFVILLSGIFICCIADSITFPIACLGMVLLGFGMPIGPVAISVYALEVSTKEKSSGTVSVFQTTLTMGGILFATVPGYLADLTGSYIPAFKLFFMIALIGALLLQILYLLIRSRDQIPDDQSVD